jgi:hypothetical protein
MGRPLNKKYFGNRNIGSTSTTTDNGIGGQGLATISTATVGSFVVNNTYKNFPLLTIGAPTLPGGVQATADVVFEIDTVTYTAGGQTNGDYVAGLSTSITGLGGGAVVRIVETLSKVTSVDLVGGNRGEFRRGDFDGTGIASHQVLQAPNAGTDLQITVTFRVKSITVVEQGSGYVAVPNLSWGGHTFTGQTSPSGQTPALTTDTGGQFQTGTGGINVSTYDENAIRAYAWDGSALVAVDIVRQVSSDRYRVNNPTTAADIDSDTTALQASFIAKLEETVANGNHTKSTGEREMNIVAFDSDGDTYLVKKLTARKAVVYPMAIARLSTSAGNNFSAGDSVPWKLFEGTSADAGYVKIENA